MDPNLPLPDGPAPPPSPETFRARRERLLERLGGGVAVVGSAPELLRSRDTEVRYRPSSDLYYLTGFEEPEAVAILSQRNPEGRFILFVRPRDPEREVWNGPRAGVEMARELTGADLVYPIDELPTRFFDLVRAADRIHYHVGDASLDERVRAAILKARTSRPRSGSGPVGADDLDLLLGEMRRVKDALEQDRMRTAARIAAAGHRAAISRAAPGVGEWELEAELEATFRRHGAGGPAYPSIVGSGPNATILHYTSNQRRVEDGDLVLVDAGAEWGMYASDITRTFPASGRFTRAQRAVYDVVLAAEEAGIAAARPGAPVSAIHDAAVRAIAAGLLELGLLNDSGVDEAVASGAYRRFYMHQTSHWLGLDVHDAGLYRAGEEPAVLEPGMVLTVEPGIYVSAADAGAPSEYRGIGVRIEDTVLITAGGCEVLTRGVPVQPEEIERLVGSARGSTLQK